MAESVKKQLARGVVWNFVEKILTRGGQFIISVILARLLMPSDYGLIGMLGVFMALSGVFVEGGFTKALVQKKDCKDIDYSTAFVTNTAVSILFYLILFFAAPWIARFYKEPVLRDLTRVMALNFVLSSFNFVQRARLTGKMDFKSLAQIRVISVFLGGVIGIIMAYTGYGVWALVGQNLGSSLISIIVFPFYSKWKPSLRFSGESFRALFGFGSKLMITGIYSSILNNISTLIIGRTYNSTKLGYYNKAFGYASLISSLVYEILSNVTFPILSHLQDEKERMVFVYRKILYFTAMIVFPIMILCTILTRPIVLIVLTEKWLPCVVMMQWLFMAKIFTPLSALNMNILNAVGRSDLFMKLDFSKAPLVLLSLIIAVPISVEAICISGFITSFICFFINAYLPGRMFGYGAFQQIKDWRFIILSLIIMAALVLLVTHFLDNVWLKLIVGGTVGVGSYIGCCFLFGVINQDMMQMIKSLRR